MKRHALRTVLLLLMVFVVSDGSHAIEGFRGATWGSLKYDMPKDEENYLLLDGWFKQGVDWARWRNTSLNTYAMIRYKWDSENTPYNNVITPALGVSLDTYNPKGFIGTIGFEYQWENRFYPATETVEKAFVYLDWVGWWDLKRD